MKPEPAEERRNTTIRSSEAEREKVDRLRKRLGLKDRSDVYRFAVERLAQAERIS